MADSPQERAGGPADDLGVYMDQFDLARHALYDAAYELTVQPLPFEVIQDDMSHKASEVSERFEDVLRAIFRSGLKQDTKFDRIKMMWSADEDERKGFFSRIVDCQDFYCDEVSCECEGDGVGVAFTTALQAADNPEDLIQSVDVSYLEVLQDDIEHILGHVDATLNGEGQPEVCLENKIQREVARVGIRGLEEVGLFSEVYEQFEKARSSLYDTIAVQQVNGPDMDQADPEEIRLMAMDAAEAFGQFAALIFEHAEQEEAIDSIVEAWDDDNRERTEMLNSLSSTEQIVRFERDDVEQIVKKILSDEPDFEELGSQIGAAYSAELLSDLFEYDCALGDELTRQLRRAGINSQELSVDAAEELAEKMAVRVMRELLFMTPPFYTPKQG